MKKRPTETKVEANRAHTFRKSARVMNPARSGSTNLDRLRRCLVSDTPLAWIDCQCRSQDQRTLALCNSPYYFDGYRHVSSDCHRFILNVCPYLIVGVHFCDHLCHWTTRLVNQ